MGVSELKNNPLLEFQPIFYKGTSFENYEEAKHVLSLNNCVLLDDLFQNQKTKPSCEATCSKKFDKEICDDSKVDSNDDDLYNDNDLLQFEGGTTDDFMSPDQISNDLSRYQNIG
jgi:hypothetical protein